MINTSLKIGKITNNTNYNINRVTFNYDLGNQLSNIQQYGSNDINYNYVQFYIVSDEGDGIGDAILKSDPIILWGSEATLVAVNNNSKLLKNNTYCLKMTIFISRYVIDMDFSYVIRKSSTSYLSPPTPPYGTIAITSATRHAIKTGTLIAISIKQLLSFITVIIPCMPCLARFL